MPTNEERREIAARLREVKTFAINRPIDELEALAFAVGCSICQEHWRVHLADRLADLIEPEPICIANITFTAKQQEELFQRVMDELRENGCPNCGAKVVSE